MIKGAYQILAILFVLILFSNHVFADEVAIPDREDGIDVLSASGQAFTLKENVEVRYPKELDQAAQ